MHGTGKCTEQGSARNSVVQGGGRVYPSSNALGSPKAIPLTTRHRSVIGVHTRLHNAEYPYTVRYMPHVHRQLPDQSPGLSYPVSLRASGTQCTVTGSSLLGARSLLPGSQEPSRAIQGKCWIDPGTLVPGSQSLIGPEMDCIWPCFSPD